MMGCTNCDFFHWRNSDFARIGDKVGPPPAERAIGDNGMLAASHELHVAIAMLCLVPIDKKDLVAIKIKTKNLRIAPAPLHTAWVGKEDKERTVHPAADILDGTAKVPILVAVAVVAQHVTSPCMYSNRL